ncbi:hypothetical protein [Bradyrhizobium iriomotense]|uniref:hypothetical protein n=1 Tax=Bradyrhizobium iriomotense TaxID=441950 RepID=UPI001B8A2845|nr:hypothetical protein [Bradyrhizobium iriomotense]MBR0784425.1 hypothetical protein [Bradyrhizobium iriomotense]
MPQSSKTSRALSPARVITRFAVRVVLLGAFAAFSSIGFGRSLVTLLWMSIILCATVALLRREQLFGGVLNHWDECAAFGALFALVQLVSAQG